MAMGGAGIRSRQRPMAWVATLAVALGVLFRGSAAQGGADAGGESNSPGENSNFAYSVKGEGFESGAPCPSGNDGPELLRIALFSPAGFADGVFEAEPAIIEMVDLYLERINADPTILPGREIKVEAYQVNELGGGAFQVAVGLTYNETSYTNLAAFLGPQSNDNGVSVGFVATNYEVPTMAWSVRSPSFSDNTRFPMFARTTATVVDLAESYAATFEFLNVTRVAVIAESTYVFGSTLSEVFREPMARHGVEMVYEKQVEVIPTDEDIMEALQEMAALDVRYVVIETNAGTLCRIIWANKEEGHLLSPDTVYTATGGVMELLGVVQFLVDFNIDIPPGFGVPEVNARELMEVANGILVTASGDLRTDRLKDELWSWIEAADPERYPLLTSNPRETVLTGQGLSLLDSLRALASGMDAIVRRGGGCHLAGALRNGTAVMGAVKSVEFQGYTGAVRFDANGDQELPTNTVHSLTYSSEDHQIQLRQGLVWNSNMGVTPVGPDWRLHWAGGNTTPPHPAPWDGAVADAGEGGGGWGVAGVVAAVALAALLLAAAAAAAVYLRARRSRANRSLIKVAQLSARGVPQAGTQTQVTHAQLPGGTDVAVKESLLPLPPPPGRRHTPGEDAGWGRTGSEPFYLFKRDAPQGDWRPPASQHSTDGGSETSRTAQVGQWYLRRTSSVVGSADPPSTPAAHPRTFQGLGTDPPAPGSLNGSMRRGSLTPDPEVAVGGSVPGDPVSIEDPPPPPPHTIAADPPLPRPGRSASRAPKGAKPGTPKTGVRGGSVESMWGSRESLQRTSGSDGDFALPGPPHAIATHARDSGGAKEFSGISTQLVPVSPVAGGADGGGGARARTKQKGGGKGEWIRLVERLAPLQHPKVARVMGLCFSPGDQPRPMLVSEYSSNGTLADVLANASISIDLGVAIGILRDGAEAMAYLHRQSPPIVHGDLKPSNLLVDERLGVKVSDYAVAWGSAGTLEYAAPEVIAGDDPTPQSDVYSFAIVMWAVLQREEPFQNVASDDVVAGVRDGRLRPFLGGPEVGGGPPRRGVAAAPPELRDLLAECWNKSAGVRPSFEDIVAQLDFLASSESNSEVYRDLYKNSNAAASSEELVHRMLPRRVVSALRAGRKVEPEQHDAVTIFFSDIVGFTTLASQMRPAEVMQMLHSLYIELDKLVERHDLFKVETIGDAYMCVGGLPDPMADHAYRAALFALDAVEAASTVPVSPEDPSMGTVQVRAGLHTGPVVASVVGDLNPRYCLFGDTVNVASRMESTGKVGLVQVSESTKAAAKEQMKHLQDTWDAYAPPVRPLSFRSRGRVVLKGKGPTPTFWVVRKSAAGGRGAGDPAQPRTLEAGGELEPDGRVPRVSESIEDLSPRVVVVSGDNGTGSGTPHLAEGAMANGDTAAVGEPGPVVPAVLPAELPPAPGGYR